MSDIATTLPLHINEISETIKVIFVGRFLPKAINFQNVLVVRRQKVYDALIWLKNNNNLYKDIDISKKNLDLLPENDVPQVLIDTVKVFDTQTTADGYVEDPLKEDVSETENEIPINVTGLVDTDGINVSTKQINNEILSKIQNDENALYAIPHSGTPINEYSNPKLLMSLYPMLFPYGVGGIEDYTKPTSISFEKHIQYLLTYADRRFERNHSFIFIVFNILQKRATCREAKILISRPYFGETASIINDLTVKDIENVLDNITKNSHSKQKDNKLQKLMQQIKTVGGKIKGSNYSRAKCRNEIHAVIYERGLPNIFITINPADVHNRVALYFAGVNLDIDKILSDEFPMVFERASIIAKNPVATARFFNKLITTLLQTLICPKNEKVGILGPISNYYGTVGKILTV